MVVVVVVVLVLVLFSTTESRLVKGLHALSLMEWNEKGRCSPSEGAGEGEPWTGLGGPDMESVTCGSTIFNGSMGGLFLRRESSAAIETAIAPVYVLVPLSDPIPGL